jgi:hypothetical protein
VLATDTTVLYTALLAHVCNISTEDVCVGVQVVDVPESFLDIGGKYLTSNDFASSAVYISLHVVFVVMTDNSQACVACALQVAHVYAMPPTAHAPHTADCKHLTSCTSRARSRHMVITPL